MKKIYILYLTVFALFTQLPSKGAMVMVETANFQFTPSNFTVNVGDTIMWFWFDGSHTTTSGNIPSGATAWNASISQNNQMFTYVVSIPGIYNFVCLPHASGGMTGSFNAIGGTVGINESPAPTLSFISNYSSNGNLYVDYELISTGILRIKLFDIIGNSVQTLVSSTQVAGKHSDVFNVTDLHKGIYILEMVTGKNRLSKKILIE